MNLEESVKVDHLKRTVKGKKLAEEFIGLLVSNTFNISFTLEPLGTVGDIALVIGTLLNIHGLRLFGTPHISFDDESGGGGYIWKSWFDLDISDGNNLKFKFWILHSSAEDEQQTINLRLNFRYIIESTENL